MKQNVKLLKKNRIPMVTWLILPLVGIWLMVNFLIGVINRPPWEIDPTGANWKVMADRTESQVEAENKQKFEWNGQGLVTFWFDDAFLSQYQVAFAILDEYGFQASLAVPTKAPGMPNYMNWAQIKHVYFRGWEINSHSYSHDCDVNNLTQFNPELEIIESKAELESRSMKADIYVPPCGAVNDQLKDMVKNNYKALRTSDGGFNDIPVTDPYNLQIHEVRTDTTEEEVLNWLSETKNSHKWLIIMFHRMDQSGELFTTTESRFRKIVKIVDDSNLPVVLPSQVLNIQTQQ